MTMHVGQWRCHSIRVSAACLGLAGAAGLTLGTAPTAVAASRDLAASTSSYLAGYQATPSAGLASASAEFKVPTVTCTTTKFGYEYFGVYTNDISLTAWVGAYCNYQVTGPSYFYIVQTPAGSFQEPAAPGDQVVTSIFQTSTTSQAEVHDLTNGQFWYANDGNLGESTINIGGYIDPSVPSFPHFAMTNAQINGDYLAFESPTQYSDYNGTRPLVLSGALTTTASGTSFGVTFKHSS